MRTTTMIMSRTLNQIEPKSIIRLELGIPELDLQFGTKVSPGIPMRKITVIYGKGGVGKSRWMIDFCKILNADGSRILYMTGELPVDEFAAEKLGGFSSDTFMIMRSWVLDEICAEVISTSPDIVVIDSINTIDEFRAGRGAKDVVEGYVVDGVSYMGLRDVAEATSCHIFLLAQMNADGTPKGGSGLPHWVDIEMYVEQTEEEQVYGIFSIMVEKNRYGLSGTRSYWIHRSDGIDPLTKEEYGIIFP